MKRRVFLQGTGAMALTGAAFASFNGPAMAQDVDMDELMKVGSLPEMALGADDAPVTVVEYASMTCGHCARFHKNAFVDLKKNYIDDGRVRFVFREFPLNTGATAAFMVARCAPPESYFEIIDILFEHQKDWAFEEDAYTALLGMARQFGFTQEKFESCLQDQEILDGINWVKERASNEFNVYSTPTLFVNGEMHRGALGFDQLEEVLQDKF